MELEFELEAEPTRRWLEETNEERAIERTKLLALQLEGLLNLCIPGTVSPPLHMMALKAVLSHGLLLSANRSSCMAFPVS